MGQASSFDAAGRPMPYYPPSQQRYYPQQPYGQPSYGPPSYWHPTDPRAPQEPYAGRHGIQEPPPERPRKDPWIVRHKVLSIIAAVALLFAGVIGAAAGGGKDAQASPAPTVTVTQTTTVATPDPTVTATATVQATQNAQGGATQISAERT